LGLPLSIFEEKIDLCKKGDEITPFDGTLQYRHSSATVIVTDHKNNAAIEINKVTLETEKL